MHLAPHRLLVVVGLIAIFSQATDVSAASIEAVQGREYKLTKQHGPWMIMVTSFRPQSPDGIVKNGKTPEELAQDLVFELRSLRPVPIPAYVYRLSAPEDRVETKDRMGRDSSRKLMTSMDQVCVIAGNYPSLEDKTAQDTLKWMKKFRPKSLQQEGVSWLETKRRQGPLGAAFLTLNPLLSPEEIAQRRQDPFLLKINSGGRHSLLENPGELTMVIATFNGKSMAHLGNSNSSDAIQAFQISDDLNEASVNAWELAVALRELSSNIDAYVWHDRYQSVVTVGAFDSPNDPNIRRYLQVFAAQPGVSDADAVATLQSLIGPAYKSFGMSAGGTGVRFLTIDSAGKKGDENRMWLFDPQPQLMRVPKMQ